METTHAQDCPPVPTAPDVKAATAAQKFDAVAWIEKMKVWRDPIGRTDLPSIFHPDDNLLELVERSLSLEKEKREMYSSTSGYFDSTRLNALQHELRNILRRANKFRASTPAGIYCKVLLVRSSQTGAAILAKSLAADLVENENLRRLIWPAEVI